MSIKRWYLLHKWTSLICTLFALLLCLTGLPLIFSHEIDHALDYGVEPPAMAETGQRANPDIVIADAKARNPGHAVQFLVGDPDEPDVWFVRMGTTADAAEASAFYIYDARTGKFLQEYPLDKGVMTVLLRLHIDLFAGLPGMLFLGFMGALLLVSLISGTVLYGFYMRKIRFGSVRRTGSIQAMWLDLHNLLGIVTLVWLFVVGITGVINTLSVPIFSRWQAAELAEMTSSYRGRAPIADMVSLQRALDTAYRAAPGMTLSFMAFPGNGFADPRHFAAFMQGATPLTSRLLMPVLIEAQTGNLVEKRELPAYVSTLLLSRPLHFGDYGGLPLKIIWALLDTLGIAVLGSGLYLWLKKRNAASDEKENVSMRIRSIKKTDSV